MQFIPVEEDHRQPYRVTRRRTGNTLRELGVPGIVGAAVGAVIGGLIAHYAAKARGQEEHARTLDRLAWQDEREAARQALDATRRLRVTAASKNTRALGL